MGVESRIESLAHKVPNVAETDENEIADVGGKQDIVRRFTGDMDRNLSARDVCTGAAVAFVGTMAKLCVYGGKDLL